MSLGLRQLTCSNLHCAKFVVWLGLVIVGQAETSPTGAVCLLQQAFSKGAGGEVEHARTVTAVESKIRQISDRLPVAPVANVANAPVSVSLAETAAQSITQPVKQPVLGASLLLHATAIQTTEARSPCSPQTPAPSPNSGSPPSPSSGTPCKKTEVVLLEGVRSQGEGVIEREGVATGTRLRGDFSDIMSVILVVVLILIAFFLYRGGTMKQLEARPVESLQTGYSGLRETVDEQIPRRQQKGTDCLGIPCC